MSALDTYTHLDKLSDPGNTPIVKQVLRAVIWDLFDQVKDQSIKLRFWGFPVSIKVAKLDQVITYLVGPRI